MRAHGTLPEIHREAKARGLQIVDATCPLVREIHEVARGMEAEGYRLIVIGDHGHDEVVGIAGQVGSADIVATPEEARILPRTKRAGVVVQSTQDINNVKSIVAELVSRCQEIRFVNTICGPTRRHQNEIRTMPLEHEVMVIVGSFTSANTCRLTQISASLNPRTHQVQCAEDLQPGWFEGVERVGVSAGASTPDRLIREVAERIASFRPGSEILNGR
jgi:4-hydroxy-3-methylbut-2-enyl diphosphate reductase